ncbi:unnamed protein product [Paramecium sonneborni]|uniref:Uncharacterized protein n=1 Tax=Paramecium sonneborni TaxID=65129 RepID=A0A8S1Q1A9_9CILI|nr:unnamed protein product [Paramecium sonneborni]
MKKQGILQIEKQNNEQLKQPQKTVQQSPQSRTLNYKIGILKKILINMRYYLKSFISKYKHVNNRNDYFQLIGKMNLCTILRKVW